MPYAPVLAPRLTAQPRNAAQMLRLNAMGYMGEPERDIGGTALFLANEYSCCVAGNTLFFDGGSHIFGVPSLPKMHEGILE